MDGYCARRNCPVENCPGKCPEDNRPDGNSPLGVVRFMLYKSPCSNIYLSKISYSL